MAFLVSNLIMGFYRDIESLTKAVFGVGAVCESEPKSFGISCVMLVRGTENIFEASTENAYASSYDWEKLDVNNEDHKKLIDQHFCWGETCETFSFLLFSVFVFLLFTFCFCFVFLAIPLE
eukprot:Pgem_evm1s1928